VGPGTAIPLVEVIIETEYDIRTCAVVIYAKYEYKGTLYTVYQAVPKELIMEAEDSKKLFMNIARALTRRVVALAYKEKKK
jgi:hypothetical protein